MKIGPKSCFLAPPAHLPLQDFGPSSATEQQPAADKWEEDKYSPPNRLCVSVGVQVGPWVSDARARMSKDSSPSGFVKGLNNKHNSIIHAAPSVVQSEI